MSWQPIDTAPKDQWLMLLMPEVTSPWHGPRIVFAHWYTSIDDVSEWCWPKDDCDLYTERGRSNAMLQLEDGEMWCSDEPTHWQELPLLP